MNYDLNQAPVGKGKKMAPLASLKKLLTIIGGERSNLIKALTAILLNAALTLSGPFLLGYTIDKYIQTKNFHGVLLFSGILLAVYLLAYLVNYAQMRMMGGIGQRMLFSLRNSVFTKLQELPLEFFNQNKAGDLISRINNDTDRVNQFFAQSLMQFIGSLISMTGAGILLLTLNLPLGLTALVPALLLLLFTKSISPWVRRKNEASLQSLGLLSAEIQESLANFKVVAAFNRRDYFRKRFSEVNLENYRKSVQAGIANHLLTPVYTFASHIGQLIVLALGIWMIIRGYFTVGLLISFIAYITNFYNPLRQMAALWANFQTALAAWDRIAHLLTLESNLPLLKEEEVPAQHVEGSLPHFTATTEFGVKNREEASPRTGSGRHVEFRAVSFHYPNGKEVLHNISFSLERGKTYAFVGPTGGGKSTTAALMARLYDPTSGRVLFNGRDIRTLTPCERSARIGFILQEPFLFSGNVRENILYGHPECAGITREDLEKSIEDALLSPLIGRFDRGLDTPVQTIGDGLSLGQKQLIAFMRAILRQPELLILDEATANIDTVTEKQLEAILRQLPASTTRVLIAHRMNTIESADEIFFVNSGRIDRAGSYQDALDMLMLGRSVS